MARVLNQPAHRMMLFTCLALIVFTGFTGCVSTLSTSNYGELEAKPETHGNKNNDMAIPANLDSIADGSWTLIRLYLGGKELSLAPGTPPTMAVNNKGKVSGLATVNRYFGQVTVEADGQLNWSGPLGATRMAGPKEQMEQEMSFLSALKRADRAFLHDGRLTLKNEEGSVILEFTH